MIFLSRALEERSFAELADEFHIGYKGVAAIYYRTIQRIKKKWRNDNEFPGTADLCQSRRQRSC